MENSNILGNTILENLIKISKKCSNLEYQWIVEAVCESIDLTDGFYGVIGYFKSEEEAENECINLTENSIHNFIVFRYKKIGVFSSFLNNNKKIVLTSDKSLNKHILENENFEKIESEKRLLKKETIEKFENSVYEYGSLANLSQLIYICYKNKKLYTESKIYETKFMESYIKIMEIFEKNPDHKNDCKQYMKTLFENIGEKHIYQYLEEFISQDF